MECGHPEGFQAQAPEVPETRYRSPREPRTCEQLLNRLRDSADNESWREFYYIYWDLLFQTARRYGLDDASADEVVQDTLVTLSRTLKDFRYDPARGSFKCWLMNQIRWKVLDFRKRQLPACASLESSDGQMSVEVFESYWDDQWRKTLITVALHRLRKHVNPRLIQTFQTRVIQGRDVDATAALLRVSKTYVYLAVFRMNKLISKELERLKKENF
jgi:RNA polymerase sigma factor (sigma-70 family)